MAPLTLFLCLFPVSALDFCHCDYRKLSSGITLGVQGTVWPFSFVFFLFQHFKKRLLPGDFPRHPKKRCFQITRKQGRNSLHTEHPMTSGVHQLTRESITKCRFRDTFSFVFSLFQNFSSDMIPEAVKRIEFLCFDYRKLDVESIRRTGHLYGWRRSSSANKNSVLSKEYLGLYTILVWPILYGI